MKSPSPRQFLILETLRGCPQGASLDQLADVLSVTRTAAMGHLTKLIDLGYVRFVDLSGAVGRPKRSYVISEEGLEVFPRQYSWLSTIMLEELAQQLGPQGVGAFMRKLGSKIAASMAAQLGGATGAGRLKQIVKILNELGYRSELKESPGAKTHLIEAVNCVYHSVAKKHPELCQFDVKFIEKTSGMDVQLESCIAKGGASCRFCVKKNKIR